MSPQRSYLSSATFLLPDSMDSKAMEIAGAKTGGLAYSTLHKVTSEFAPTSRVEIEAFVPSPEDVSLRNDPQSHIDDMNWVRSSFKAQNEAVKRRRSARVENMAPNRMAKREAMMVVVKLGDLL